MKRFLIVTFVIIGFLFLNSKPDYIKSVEATATQCTYDLVNIINKDSLYCD